MAGTNFGSCCEELKEALEGGDFEPLITVGSDQVIYMTVGLVDLEEDEPGLVDHPLFFCPFCGTKLQTPEEVRAKSGAGDEDDEDGEGEKTS
ncbi:MAG: hypothetical protein JNL45_02825 [Hyphomicrobium sp.]|jgi:hypothetical protein|nr:hypothetical protein [Hyphomicrobium sp.]